MRRLTLLATIAFVASLFLAPAAMAQNQFNCPDFATQEQAQAVLDQDSSDPNRLDANSDGVACEDLPSGAGQQQSMMEEQPQQPMMETTTMTETTVMGEPTMMGGTTQPLPKSGGPVVGGPSVLLPAAALLLGAGVLGFAILRRR